MANLKSPTDTQWADLVKKVKAKQDTLVSGTTIKTINNTSVLGSGNISISVPTISNSTGTSTANGISQKAATDAINAKQDKLTSGTNIKTINGTSLLGSGNIVISASGGGATFKELTWTNGEAASGAITLSESADNFDALIIQATARCTVTSDVTNRSMTYTHNVNAIAMVDYRYGANNQYASWICNPPMSAEVQYWQKPRMVAVSVNVYQDSISFQLNVSSASLMSGYRDWTAVTFMNPTDVKIIGIKF